MEPDDKPKDHVEPSANSDAASENSELTSGSSAATIPQVVLLVSGLVVFASGWFVLIFVQHDVFFSANHVLYFEPMARFVGEALHEGRIPLWNPYCYSGMPQIANLTPSPFYPFTWLFTILGYDYAVALSIVIHELIGLGGAYLLLRIVYSPLQSRAGSGDGSGGKVDLSADDGGAMNRSSNDSESSTGGAKSAGELSTYSKLSCLAGAVVFMLCGCLQPGAANFTIAATAAWIPWCFWAQIRLQQATQRAALAGGVAVLAIAAAMNMLAGCIELSMLTMGFVKFLVILDAVKRFRAGESWFPNALRQWCALLIGTLIAAPSMLPATEWLLDKLQYPVSVAMGNRADFVATLLGFLYPTHQSYRFTEIASIVIDGTVTGELLAVDHVITCFGPIVLALAAFGLSGKVLISRRAGTPGRSSNGNSKAETISEAAKDSNGVNNSDPAETRAAGAARRRQLLIAAGVVATAVFSIASLEALDLPLFRFLPSAFLCHPTAPFMVLMSLALAFAVAEGMTAIEGRNIRYALLVALVLSLVPCSYFNVDAFCTTKRDDLVVTTKRVRTAGTTIGDDRAGALKENKIDEDTIAKTSTKVLQNERIAISPVWAIPALVSGPNEQVDSFTVGKEANRNINQKLLNACGYQSTPSSVYRYVVVGRKFLDPRSIQALTGASIVALPKREDYTSKYPEAEVERLGASAVNRCSATIDWAWKDSPAQAIAAIGDENFLSNPSFIERNSAQSKDTERLQHLPSGLLNPPKEAPSASPEKELLTREELQRRYKSLEELKATQEAASLHGKVELMRSEPEHVVVSVILDKPAFVILKDAFYPGWKVSIDAIPTTCYRANGIDRAVYVDKGSHLVQFDFKPDSYALGLKCFVMGLAVFFYLAIWSIARVIVKTIRFLSYGVWEE